MKHSVLLSEEINGTVYTVIVHVVQIGVSYKKSRITWGCWEAECCLNHSFQPCNVAVFAVILSLALCISADQRAASVTNIPFNLLSLSAWLISFLFWCTWRVTSVRWQSIYPEWTDHVTIEMQNKLILLPEKRVFNEWWKDKCSFTDTWRFLNRCLQSWSVSTSVQSKLLLTWSNWSTSSLI